MEATKLIGFSHGGKLTISVPAEYDEKELEIMIISSKDIKAEKDNPAPEKIHEDEKEF